MRQPLGRGLDAILGGANELPTEDSAYSKGGVNSGKPLMVPIERVIAGRGQPRRTFDDKHLEELAASIRENGILQPLVVVARSGSYELIAGERRLRAAARAGLDKVPVVIREGVSDSQHLELALVENIQREDLGPLERARAYERLLETYGHTQDDIARKIGKSRSAVANTLRLLALPQPVLEALEQGLLSEGHARPLLALPTASRQIEGMQVIIRRALSVRDAEQLVKEWTQSGPDDSGEPHASKRKQPSSLMEQSLSRTLGTKVRLRGSDAKGRIEIEFYSREELTRLIEILTSRSSR